MQELGSDRRLQLLRALVDEPHAELDVAEERALGRGAESRAAAELAHPSDVVEQGGGKEQVAAQPGVELCRLAAERRDPDRVLQQPARIPVVAVRARGGEQPHAVADLRVGEHIGDQACEAGVRKLGGEELEEAVELVGIPPHRRCELGGIGLGRLDRPDLELQAAVEALDAGQHAYRVPSSKRRSRSSTSSQMRPSIRPLASTSSSAR